MRKTTVKKPIKRVCEATPAHVTIVLPNECVSATLSVRLEIATKRYEDAINNLIAKL